MTLAQHSAATPEHYTPPAYVEAARAVMGAIDLDPATTAAVNDSTVRARKFFTRADDGLSWPWRGRVWMNPPGGVTRGRSNQAIWWDKLAREYLAGYVEQAVFLGFSIEILATSQDSELWIGELPFCVPRQRIEFLRAHEGGGVPGMRSLFDEPKTIFAPGESPTHANVLAYLPPAGEGVEQWQKHAAIRRFAAAFAPFGRVRWNHGG